MSILSNNYFRRNCINKYNFNYNNLDINDISINNNSISIFCLNICSFLNKWEEIEILIETLKDKFLFIAFLETKKLETKIIDCILPTHNHIYIQPKLNKSGGILLMVNPVVIPIEKT
jgi:hypothetical protein